MKTKQLILKKMVVLTTCKCIEVHFFLLRLVICLVAARMASSHPDHYQIFISLYRSWSAGLGLHGC